MTEGVKYYAKGHGNTVFRYHSSSETTAGKTVVKVTREDTHGLYNFYPDDLTPVSSRKRKYTTKLPEELRIPEGRAPRTIEAFGRSVILL
jgi:hypothetical protein